MRGKSLLSWLSASGFVTAKKETVTTEVNPQVIGLRIKSTVPSYPANWKRALVELKQKPTEPDNPNSAKGPGTDTWSEAENVTFAPVVFLHLNSVQMDSLFTHLGHH